MHELFNLCKICGWKLKKWSGVEYCSGFTYANTHYSKNNWSEEYILSNVRVVVDRQKCETKFYSVKENHKLKTIKRIVSGEEILRWDRNWVMG
jgi:hypothetical protein